jgi:hypothetical protein
MFAVAGGPMFTRAGWLGLSLEVFLTDGVPFGAAGFGGTPPYFSKSSCVELYLVAALSLSIVLVR